MGRPINVIDNTLYKDVKERLDKFVEMKGFECHPFKIGWYNAKVESAFKLPYSEDTLAFVVISLPCMFEKTFKPFLKKAGKIHSGLRDPIDDCMVSSFLEIKEILSSFGCDIFHDFELLPNRRPKILVQTAAHVSGAAFYYKLSDVTDPPWSKSKKIFGVCIHPEYGGWFAIRGVIVLSNVLYLELPHMPAKDIVDSQELRVRLLEEFNFNWEDWRYRDIVHCKDKYSDDQKLYFSTKPSDRRQLLNYLVDN